MTDQNKPGQPRHGEQVKQNQHQNNPQDRQHQGGDKKNQTDNNPEPSHTKE